MFTDDERSKYGIFISSFNEECDRGAVLVGAILLDESLNDLLSERLGKKHGVESFGRRIELSFKLGMISNRDRLDLITIQKIRNNCAHRLSGKAVEKGGPLVPFSFEGVKVECNSFHIVSDISRSPFKDYEYFKGPKKEFLWTLAVLHGRLIAAKIQSPPAITLPDRRVRFESTKACGSDRFSTFSVVIEDYCEQDEEVIFLSENDTPPTAS